MVQGGLTELLLVTTIQGSKSQAPKVTVNARASVSALPPQYDMLNPTEFGEMLWMSYENSENASLIILFMEMGATPVIPKYIYPSVTNDIDLSNYSAYDYQIVESTPEGTNWFDYIYQNAITQDYDMRQLLVERTS